MKEIYKKFYSGIITTTLIFLVVELVLGQTGYCPVIKQTRYMIFTTDKGFLITDGIIPKDHILFVRDPYLFWRLKYPSDEFHFVNSKGFRGRLINQKKPKNTFRIFCIGDSCTFGLGVRYFEAYPYILERLLNENSSKIKYEVINAGVPGYSSLQGLRFLERDILKYKPDLIIASFGWNDTYEALGYSDKQQKSPNKIFLLIHSFLSNSRVYLFLEDVVLNLRFKLGTNKGQAISMTDRLLRVPEEDFVDNVSNMAKLRRLYHFEVILLNQPCRILVPHKYESLLRRLNLNQDIPLLDLQERLNSSGIPVTSLFIDVQHPTALGHRLIAQAIYDFFKKETIVEKYNYLTYKFTKDI